MYKTLKSPKVEILIQLYVHAFSLNFLASSISVFCGILNLVNMYYVGVHSDLNTA